MIETRQPRQTLKRVAWLAYVFHFSNDFFRKPPPLCCRKNKTTCQKTLARSLQR